MRRQYIDYLVLKGRSEKTIRVYIKWVRDLANYYHCSPDKIEDHDITAFVLHLHYNGKAKSTINQAVNAIRGFYRHVLNRPADQLKFVVPRTSTPKKVPRAYSISQIERLFKAAEPDPFQYTFLFFLYHTGMRLNEGCHAVFSDIERESCRVIVRGGKGDKDRYTLFPYMLEEQLDRYYYDYYFQLGYLHCPRWLLNCVEYLVPKPDLAIFFDRDAREIYATKPELTVAEIEREQKIIRELLANRSFGRTIDASKGIEPTIEAVKAEITQLVLSKNCG